MLELAVVGLLLALVSVWAAQAWAQRVRDLQAQSLAVWMTAAQSAAQSYLRLHGLAIGRADGTDALAHEGFGDWSAPGWDEMRAAGLVPPGWADAGPLGHGVGLRVLRSGACPGAACRLAALVHTRQPLLGRDGRAVDEGLVAQWLMAAQGRGMVAWPGASRVLSGAGRRLPAPEDWPAGIVALVVDDEGAVPSGGDVDLSPYLRVRDARDPEFQGDATVVGDIRGGASLWARDSLVLERSGTEHSGCAEEGALTTEGGHDGILLCRQGRWRSAGRAGGGGFLSHSRQGCADSTGAYRGNPLTGDCSCPFNYTPVMVSDAGSMTSAEGRTTGFICVAMR
ncbi:hypothetical protein [Castellaniella sp. GW247-6E4]|uniref:hypothetical protein n=1 Tax=Castellaniella sp. GW247-6E4 TaxID=3140380 RepID=UPI003314F0B7